MNFLFRGFPFTDKCLHLYIIQEIKDFQVSKHICTTHTSIFISISKTLVIYGLFLSLCAPKH